MGSTQYGHFAHFCRDSFLPICNILVGPDRANQPPGTPYRDEGETGTCVLYGISLSRERHLANLGSVLTAGLAIFVTLALIWRSERKVAAVGRREMQLFLFGFLIISICEIFSVGGFPLHNAVRKSFTAAQIAAITTTSWWLMLNAFVGYQMIDDGSLLSMGLMLVSGLVLFLGTLYIALDTAFNWTNYFAASYVPGSHYNPWLYSLYQLCPLVFMFVYFVLESFLVLKVLREIKPMIYLTAAALLFAVGQIFMYVISVHICRPTHGAINGTFFETLFTLLSVITIWIFWSFITEDDWPLTV